MDNYGNDVYLSQDGYPSIDFTLLDRPSSSMVSARESVAHFPQGDSSFPSFNLFDGTGAVSYNDRLVADHGSYVLEAHKNAMKRRALGGFVPNQSEGVHDFFEQGNQPQRSDSGTWHRNEQSAYFLPRASSADERVQRPFHLKRSYEADAYSDNTERSSSEASVPHRSIGFLKPMAGEVMDRSKLTNVSLAAQNELRNHALNAQGVLNLPLNNNFGPRNSAPFKSAVPSHQSTLDNMSYFGAHFQNQVDNYDVSNQTGVVFNNAPSYDFLGNQVPWKGAIQHSQATSKQLQGPTRTTGLSELQAQHQQQKQQQQQQQQQQHHHHHQQHHHHHHQQQQQQQQQQLQEMFLAHQLKQLEDSRQEQVFQQAPNQFSRTSYSELLHGPDTPPSQHQTAEEYENQASVLPSQNSDAVGWSIGGPLYYQEVASDMDMEQNQNLASQMSFFGEAVNSGNHLGNMKDQRDQNGPSLASYSVEQNVVTEQIGGNWKSPSSQQAGKPLLQSCHSGSQHLAEARATDFGIGNDWNNESRKANQPHAKFGATQNPSGELTSRQKGRGASQVNVFSQSQQLFQGLQFSEQRNFSSEPKQPVPSPNLNLPPQSQNSATSFTKNGMQQCSNSFSTMDNFAGYVSHNLARSPLDVTAASGQPQWLTSSSLGSPSRPTSVEGGFRHQANSWEGLQAHQPSGGTGFNLQPFPDTKYNTMRNSNPQQQSQQGSPMFGVQPGPFEASVARQQGLYNTQASSMNVKTSVAGSGSVSNQQIHMSSHDFRKEVGGAIQPLSESGSHFQGVWKKYTPPNQFPPDGGSLGQQSLDGLRPRHAFQHQGYLNSEASLHTPAVSNDFNNHSAQYSSSQLVREEQLPLKRNQLLERHVSQDQIASLPTANFMKTLNRQAMKVVPDVMEEVQGGMYKSMEPQDISIERQREVPQQQVNSCTESVSLAHLRGNQSSSPLSPQYVRLGLGPSHDLQQLTDASWRSFSHTHTMGDDMPTLKSAHRTLNAESPHRTAFSDMTRKDDIEVNQGSSAAMKQMVLQSSATPPSVFINRAQPALRETASSDTSPSSSFASGHVMGGTSLVSASPIPYSHEYNTGLEPPQTRDKLRGDLSSGLSQVQTSASNCVSHRDALNGYIGKSSSISDYSGLPTLSAGAPPVQKKYLIESSTQLGRDGGGMHILHDHDLNRKVGNRLNAADFKESATASKASKLEQSKLLVLNEQQFSGILESSRMPSSSARGISSGEQKKDTVQRAPTILRNSNNRRGEEHSVLASSMQHTFNDQLNVYRVTQSGNEVSGLMPSTPFPNIQGELHHFAASVSSGLSNSLQGGVPSQDSNTYQNAKSLNSQTSEIKAVGRNSRRPPLRAPFSSVIGPGVQPPSHEDLRQRQNSGGLEPSARTGRFPESATLPLPESDKVLKSRKNIGEPICSGKLLSTTEDQVFSFDPLQQHNVPVSESKTHSIPEPVGTFGDSQLPKGSNKSYQTVPYPTNFNHLSLSSVGPKHTTVEASEKPPILLQQSAGNKENQVQSIDNQVPLGLESSTSKEEVSRTLIQVPVSTSKTEGQLSPSKVMTPEEGAPPLKKRKKGLPLLIPWHIAAAKSNISLPSNSDAELMWASALNRLPDKDFNATLEDNASSVFRAKRRLLLTTESMQRLFPPLPDGMMNGTTPAERECGIYSLSKLALEDACRLVAKTNGQAVLAQTSPSTINTLSQGQACGMAENRVLTNCVESFMERVKQLGMELARLDCSTSVSELQGETQELEKLSIVNRLAKHHGIGFTMDSSDNLFIENIFEFGLGARKPLPQRYVSAAPMPRTLPEGVRCLSL